MSLPAVRMSWRAVMLALVSLLCVALFGLRAWKGTETGRILRTAARQVKVPELHRDLPHLYADFAGIRDRTPFYATRKVHVPPPKSQASRPPVPNYVFNGALIPPRGPAVALLSNPTNGSTLRVIAGKEVGGWQVEAVEASRVVLRYEDQSAEIKAATKQASSSGADGMTRAPVIRGNHTERGGAVRVLGEGQSPRDAQTLGGGEAVVRRAPAASNLPPLAGSGSESITIPPPPR